MYCIEIYENASSFPFCGSITAMHVQSKGVYLEGIPIWEKSALSKDEHRRMFFFRSTYSSDDDNYMTEILQMFFKSDLCLAFSRRSVADK